MGDYKGAELMLDAVPQAKAMLGDKGYDADWLRDALSARGTSGPAINDGADWSSSGSGARKAWLRSGLGGETAAPKGHLPSLIYSISHFSALEWDFNIAYG
ncbi:hypothetical protein [Mesorhizobium sp. WSM3873]|uniref:hypothetical protein n=1 Tax=Mesorhizobium sp. WSM3873 TaxID=1854056 RepID=UPI0012EA6600|nr:hypothetical protein [Mesorhizobium sp. WSM3873]